ncbi:MAG TPA: tRNA (adenosine(37)-N6)-dimethylallyltransferase MiaA [Rhizomicrobium sp.]|jgi:tRNA dimethylallyltransferase
MKFDAVLIAGPTASGKSRAAIELARQIDGVVINADSMQVYREGRILTARPTESDTALAPHLLYGHVGAHDAYSAGRFQTDAGHALKEARAAGRVPIFTGGTGLYFDVLVNGIAEIPSVSATIRKAVATHRAEIGEDAFFAELTKRDPKIAGELKPGDSQRVLRAYEVFEASGLPLSHWQTQPGDPVLGGMRLAMFVLDVPRKELRERIAARFDTMVETGAMEEALALRDLDPTLPAAKIIGRRELIAVHDGRMALDAAKTLAVTATGQYAKRQDTWFRNRMAGWHRIDAQDFGNIVTKIAAQLAE